MFYYCELNSAENVCVECSVLFFQSNLNYFMPTAELKTVVYDLNSNVTKCKTNTHYKKKTVQEAKEYCVLR